MEGTDACMDRRFLLHVRLGGDAARIVSLRDVADGRLRTFSGLREMLGFLESQTTAATPAGAERVPATEDAPEGEET